MALYHFSAKVFSRGTRNTVNAIAYRAGCKLYDERTGENFDHRSKAVEHVELLLPHDGPEWAVDAQKLISVNREKGVQALCTIVESAEKRIDGRVWREFEFALHRELTRDQNMALAREFVQDQICGRGMAAQLNFHFDVDPKTGKDKPHCHVVVPTRRLGEKGMDSKKEEAWNKKEFLLDLRVQWQEYSNFHLKLHGHDVRIDHRSYHERGIEIEPQPKMGKNLWEIERRIQALEGSDIHTPITDKAKAFHECKLRNLYRIMRRPEVVLEIVSKHNATFMWADVQKVLHRYVDEEVLFQRLESKLKNSHELLVLRAEGVEGEKAIYTTRTLLEAEKSLIKAADTLGASPSHKVKDDTIQQAISKANQDLQMFGGLSSDQIKAITHLTEEGQLKCVVGIAGAGKTTALGVCHDIWKTEGYAVYGLAPTGKAAQNLETKSLEQSGIPSMTLHKFLKSYEEGRCQYNPNSVLVLDEAGMVDIERFEQLLGTVKQLGIKLIVVGDGAQLQPVEAGPAFRLVTQRLGKSELNTVLRQKEEWQREATVLFGKQDTQAAIQKYMDKGHVHIVEEKLPTPKHSLYESLDKYDREGVVRLYEIASRTSSLMYREMRRDMDKMRSEEKSSSLKQHQDFERYQEWMEVHKSTAAQIMMDGSSYRSILETRSLDPLKMALLFVDKKQNKDVQRDEAYALLEKHGLHSLIGIEKSRQSVDVRQETKVSLIQSWHNEFKKDPTKTSLMLAFSNRDVGDLNASARSLLKKSGHISKDEITYTTLKRNEDDFGKQRLLKEQKNFSKGDRIVFTRNDYGLGVKNGTMGTITELNKQTLRVKLDREDGKEISFAPNLNPYFDHGWAITIHKSQGTSVDQTYVLASYEMTQNLAYVAMTRHRENVQVFGSNLDFWRPEKLPEVLSKLGEKLSAADYLDAESLNKLMQQEDRLLTKIFNRISNELEAMGAVSKRAFWHVADHLLGTNREEEIKVAPEISHSSIREEARAEKVLQKPAESSFKTQKLPTAEHQKTPSSYANLVTQCEERLRKMLKKANKPLTPERRTRISLQAERTANFISHAYSIKGISPSEKEIKQFSLRAKYELNRIPEIRTTLLKEWEDKGKVKPYSGIRAVRLAERLASIEGRLCLEAKQKGLELPASLANLARQEFKAHKSQTPQLAKELSLKYDLSEKAAFTCAQNVFRYKETHGECPSEDQIKRIAQIAKNLETKNYNQVVKTQDPQQLEFLRRKEGDLLFQYGGSHQELSNQTVKKIAKGIESQLVQERERDNQREL